MKKGFTLIELLAVIVILAIIAVIAVPIVLNIISDSKKNASLRSADFYLDALEYAVADRVVANQAIEAGTYNILENGNICIKYTDNACTDEMEIEVNGEKPTGGTITILNGEVESLSLKYNNQTIVKNEKGELEYSEPLCTIERQDTTKYSVGDVITCTLKNNDFDKFYVVEETELSSKSIKILTEDYLDASNYVQNKNASGIAFASSLYWGYGDFESPFVYYDFVNQDGSYPYIYSNVEGSLVAPIVEGYVDYLETNGLYSVSGKLLSYEEADYIVKNYDNISWLSSGENPYWLGSLEEVYPELDGNMLFTIYNPEYYSNYIMGHVHVSDSLGVRPIIIMSTENIK